MEEHPPDPTTLSETHAKLHAWEYGEEDEPVFAANVNGWQPIETAPKDGTRIDLWVVTYDGTGVVQFSERECDCFWVNEEWYSPERDYHDGDFIRPPAVVAFWRPLPAPPPTEQPA